MPVRKLRAASLIAASACAVFAGRASAQYTIAGSYSFGPNGNPGTDDTGPNQTGNAVVDSSALFQSYGAPAQAVVPGSYIQGAGSPYAIGTVGSKIQTGTGFQGPSYTTSTTAFYYSPTTGFNYFGQYNTSTNIQYVDTGATTNYSTGSPSATFVSTDSHYVSLSAENAVGQAVGSEQINSLDSKTNGIDGQHAFLFTIPTNTGTGLGLTSLSVGSTGASYAVNFNYSNISSTTSQATYEYSSAVGIDNLGDASGQSSRYFAYGGDYQSTTPSLTGTLGTSAFFYNSKTQTSVETGLYGPGYSYQKTIASLSGLNDGGTGTYASNTDRGINNGYQVGTVTPYIDNGNSTGTSLGTEGWTYSPATGTTPVSLYQSGLTPNIAGFGTSYNGSALSYSYAVTSSVNSATGNYRSTTITALNASGLVGGNSSYYAAGSTSAKGTDSWIYTPATQSYQQVGLLTNGFASGGTSSFVNLSAQRSSNIAYINAGGASVGTSTEYLSSGPGGAGSTGTTTVSWFTPAGGSSIQIGPTDANHTAVSSTLGSYVNDSVTIVTDTGYVAGSATRYLANSTTTNGTDAWVYNSNTGELDILDPNPNSTTAFTSQISYLAPNGIAVGEYKVGSNGYYQAFAWSAYSGFIDLTSDTPETDPNITELTDAISYNPVTGTIITTGQYVSGGVAETPGGGVAYLTGAPIAVPEPASLAVIGGLAAAGLLRRRRHAR